MAPLIEIKWADTGFSALEAETLVLVLIKGTYYHVVPPWKCWLAVGRGEATAVAPGVVRWCWLPGSSLLLLQFSLCCWLTVCSSLWTGSVMALRTLSLPRLPNPSSSLDFPSFKVSCFGKGLILLTKLSPLSLCISLGGQTGFSLYLLCFQKFLHTASVT